MWCSAGLAEQKSSAQSEPKTHDAASIQQSPPPSDPVPTYSSLIDQNACRQSKDEHQEELCIEWRSASAAEAQAFWSKSTFWIGVVGTAFVLGTLLFTRDAAKAAQVSALAAQNAVEGSAATLAHAQAVAERDLRPWLTVEAFLDSPIAVDDFSIIARSGDKFEFYARLRVQNVGKSAARNVVYRLSAADFGEVTNPDEWFEETVRAAVFACNACVPARQNRFEPVPYNDSLAPSEKHKSRRWCSFGGTAPGNQPAWKGYEFCVSVVAAYMGASDDEVFYTAKIFPVGFPEVPVFQRFISPSSLPIGTGDIAFGPVRKARAT